MGDQARTKRTGCGGQPLRRTCVGASGSRSSALEGPGGDVGGPQDASGGVTPTLIRRWQKLALKGHGTNEGPAHARAITLLHRLQFPLACGVQATPA